MMTTKHWTVSIHTFTQGVISTVKERTISNAFIFLGDIRKRLKHLDILTFGCADPGYFVFPAFPCGVNEIGGFCALTPKLSLVVGGE